MYDAIILAGGQNSERFRQFSPQRYEAMIDIAGKPMVTFVAEALAASGYVDRIFILGPVAELETCQLPERVIPLEGGSTILQTIQIGIKALGHQRKTLIATGDIPLLTHSAVNDFITRCAELEADLYYPIIGKQVNNTRYPGAKRTYVRLKEGTFTGGNIFLVNPAILPNCMAIAEKIIENRKHPFKLAQMLGWSFVMQFLLGTLSLYRIQQRVSELLEINGAVVFSDYPELGLDVDKPSDLELVRGTMARA